MKQEHLKDQTRQQFNQGIRRSLRSGLLIGLISALIIGTISILQTTLTDMLNTTLRSGLRFWLSSEPNNFPVELTFQLRFIWIWLPAAIVVMWALSGGLTILRHYVIRWLLAGHRIFPFRAQAFLDDATSRILLRRVGGGYSFIHRRLQDYFADAAVTQPGPGPRYRQNRTEA